MATSFCVASYPDDVSLTTVLDTRDRMEIIRTFRSWEGPLSDEESQALAALVQKDTHKDWLLEYEANALHHRCTGRSIPFASSTIDGFPSLARLIVDMRTGKIPTGFYDDRIDALGKELVQHLNRNVHFTIMRLLDYNEPFDFHRKYGAIKLLAHVGEKEESIGPRLMRTASEERNRQLLEEELLALLKLEPTEEMLDWVAKVIIQRKASDQGYVISFLSRSPLPIPLKMRLYSHLNLYERDGQYAVVRALGEIHTQEAFQRLCDILRENARGRWARENTRSLFKGAARALERIEEPDPCPALLEAIRICSYDRFEYAALILAERDYAPAVEVFESRLAEAEHKDESKSRLCRIVCAGALARFDKDYDKNAALVREELLRDPGYSDTLNRVVGWLHDEETAKAVGSVLDSAGSEHYPEHYIEKKPAIATLGQIGHAAGLPALRRAVLNAPTDGYGYRNFLSAIAEAVEAIGNRNDNPDLIQEGEELHAFCRWLAHAYPASRPPEELEEVPLDMVANVLKRYPNHLPVFLDCAAGRRGEVLEILDLAWSKALIPYLDVYVQSLEERGRPEEERAVWEEFVLQRNGVL